MVTMITSEMKSLDDDERWNLELAEDWLVVIVSGEVDVWGWSISLSSPLIGFQVSGKTISRGDRW